MKNKILIGGLVAAGLISITTVVIRKKKNVSNDVDVMVDENNEIIDEYVDEVDEEKEEVKEN